MFLLNSVTYLASDGTPAGVIAQVMSAADPTVIESLELMSLADPSKKILVEIDEVDELIIECGQRLAESDGRASSGTYGDDTAGAEKVSRLPADAAASLEDRLVIRDRTVSNSTAEVTVLVDESPSFLAALAAVSSTAPITLP